MAYQAGSNSHPQSRDHAIGIAGEPSQTGVFWNEWRGKWEAWIYIDQQLLFLGLYDTTEQAIYAYNAAVISQCQEQNAGPRSHIAYQAASHAPGRRVLQVRNAGSQVPEQRAKSSAAAWPAGLYKENLQSMQPEHPLVSFSKAEEMPLQRQIGHSKGKAGGVEAAEQQWAAQALASLSSTATRYDDSPPSSTQPIQSGRQNAQLITPGQVQTPVLPVVASHQSSSGRAPNSCKRGAAPLSEGQKEEQGYVPPSGQKSSKYKGVSWHKHSQKWYAYIQYNGKMHGLGYFHVQEQAAAAYDSEARRVHKEKAILNFPNGMPLKLDDTVPQGQSGPLNAPGTAPQSLARQSMRNPEQGIKWNPADGRYHYYVWDRVRNMMESRGSFESKHAAIRAMYTETVKNGGPKTGMAVPDKDMTTSCMSSRQVSSDRLAPALPSEAGMLSKSDSAGFCQGRNQEIKSLVSSPLKKTICPQGEGLVQLQTKPDTGLAQGTECEKGQLNCESAIKPIKETSEANDSFSGNACTDMRLPAQGIEEVGKLASTGSDLCEKPTSLSLVDASLKGLPPRSSTGKRSRSHPEVRLSTGRASSSHRGSSRYKGVSWSDRSGKWRAQMWFGNKVHHLGFFDTEEGAAKCYDAAVVGLRGPSAPTNFKGVMAEASGLDAEVLRNVAASSLPKVTSRYRGVRWHYCNSKWEARIFNGTRQISLGYFDQEIDAAAAYDEQAWNMRGSAAVMNFPAPEAEPADLNKTGPLASGLYCRAAEALPLSPEDLHPHPSAEGKENMGSPAKLTQWGSKRRRG